MALFNKNKTAEAVSYYNKVFIKHKPAYYEAHDMPAEAYKSSGLIEKGNQHIEIAERLKLINKQKKDL